MGACQFWDIGKGKTVDEAFHNAVEQACWEHGHGGYTGSIAEKPSFVLITDIGRKGVGKERAYAYADELFRKNDHRITDKWGPAGAIKIREGVWLFFGFASE